MSIRGNWDRRISRQAFLGIGGMGAAALALGARGASAAEAGYGRLRPDPRELVDLPEGFRYRVISREGTKLSKGAPVPSDHDGMAAFRGPKRGTTLLVRNHELSSNDRTSNQAVEGSNPYDSTQIGGTTGILVDNESRKVIKDFVTSSGQSTNCAGGATPWGTWLSGTGQGAGWLRDHAKPGQRARLSEKVFGEGARIGGRAGVVNGGPRLVEGGEPEITAYKEGFVYPENPEFYYRFGERRNPRTLAGTTPGGNLVLVAVDGRRPGYSVGASFEESAGIMDPLRSDEAVNLDGGGSTGMTVEQRLVTQPSDATGERPIGDAVVLLP